MRHSEGVKLMFEQFQESHPNVNCKERPYRRLLKEMNVGYAKLGEEECEDCREFSLHCHENEEIELTRDVEGQQEGQGKTAYTPPDELISVIDYWAETVLADSGICLKDDCDICTRWKLHATREEYCRDINHNNKPKVSFISPVTWKKLCGHVSPE